MTTTNIWVDMLDGPLRRPHPPFLATLFTGGGVTAACAGPLRRRHTRRRPRVEGRGAEQEPRKAPRVPQAK